MTKAAARAKRLFDRGRWRAAAEALAPVVSGATGDDLGNLQLAEYHQAIALYQLNYKTVAARAFVRIARRRQHLKFAETSLWLVKLITEEPARRTLLCPVVTQQYELSLSSSWSSHTALRSRFGYECGHVEFEAGRYPTALQLFANVSRQAPDFVRAQLLSADARYRLGQAHAARSHLDLAVAAAGKNRTRVEHAAGRLRKRHEPAIARWRNPALRYFHQRGFHFRHRGTSL